ncbi:MAG: PEP-CTERM sorting domain-containing protein [Phycisphaerales bacterium]|nr:PEP-CTERM sorting domain-containing protein [Phycisphaerales bacterium]
MLRTRLFIVLSFLAATHGSVALASPLFTLDDPADFQAALDDGRITPMTTWDRTFELLYPGLESEFRPLQLSVDDDGLVLDFGEPNDDFFLIGGYTYTYPEDPDLTSTRVEKTINFAKTTIANSSLSVHLLDEAGKYKLYLVPVPAGSMAMDVSLDASGTAFIAHTDAGFDLKKVVAISYDLRIKGKATTRKLSVVPAPATLSLLTLGGLLAVRRRR